MESARQPAANSSFKGRAYTALLCFYRRLSGCPRSGPLTGEVDRRLLGVCYTTWVTGQRRPFLRQNEEERMDPVTTSLFTEFSPLALVTVGIVAFGAAVIGGLGGAGVSLMLVPLLAPILGIKSVIPMMTVAMVIGNGSRIWAFWKGVNFRVGMQFYLPAIPGLILGVTIYEMLPERALYGLLGFMLIGMVPLRRFFEGRRLSLSPRGVSSIGAGYGVINGSMTGTGGILVGTLLGAGLHGGALIATKAVIGIGQAVVKITMFSLYGLLTWEYALAGLMIGVCMIPGAFLARWMIERMNLRRHTIFIETLIVIGGLSLMYRFIFFPD